MIEKLLLKIKKLNNSVPSRNDFSLYNMTTTADKPEIVYEKDSHDISTLYDLMLRHSSTHTARRVFTYEE